MYLDKVAAGASADGRLMLPEALGKFVCMEGKVRHGAGPLGKSAKEEGCPFWGVIGMMG